MPVESNKQGRRPGKISTTSSKKPMRQRGILFICLILGLIFAAAGVATFFIPENDKGSEMQSEGIRMEKYLSDKYGQEFVVENVRETGTGLAVKGSWRGDAYPKSDSSLKFEIRKSQTTDEIDYETFLQVLWTKQGTPEVEDFLAREFPNKEYYSLRISPGNSPGNSLYDLIQGETPSLDEALNKHKDIMAYELAVNEVRQDVTDEPSTISLERAMKIVNFIKSKEIGVPYINYGYRDVTYTEKNDSGQQKYQYRIKLEREQTQGISSSGDLKQYFQVVKY